MSVGDDPVRQLLEELPSITGGPTQYALLIYGSESGRETSGPLDGRVADVLSQENVTAWARLHAHWGRVVATLVGTLRDVELAEDATRPPAARPVAAVLDQDHALWDEDQIGEGRSLLQWAITRADAGPYTVAELHSPEAGLAVMDGLERWPEGVGAARWRYTTSCG